MVIVSSHQLPRLLAADHQPLVNHESLGRDALLSIPTSDHYLPLLYVLGIRVGGERPGFPVEGGRWRLDFHARRSNRLKKTRLTESRFFHTQNCCSHSSARVCYIDANVDLWRRLFLTVNSCSCLIGRTQ